MKNRTQGNIFPIAGIGASAGGISAIEALLSAMPKNYQGGISLVFILHLAPDQKSKLSEIINRFTSMKVYEIVDGIELEPNSVYIIPPNFNLKLSTGKLFLTEPTEPRFQQHPVDFFFRSMADDQKERAIGIILSGTGSDGALGIRRIKGEGGMTMVQNPDSAEFSGMPEQAIATGMVDFILAPSEMPPAMINYADNYWGKPEKKLSSSFEKNKNAVNMIVDMLRNHTGQDFSGYKQNMVIRRMERRMAIGSIQTVNEYLALLQESTSELNKIFQDLLIGVTNFFRDADAFAELEKNIIPAIFNANNSNSLRIWVCACSTGEEAYSLAIIIYEFLEKFDNNYQVQIFATDIDSNALEIARKGYYPVSIEADISPARLKRFFIRENNGKGYRVQKNIREMVVFSCHNVIKDPPFSRLDLISCRNLLIYLDSEQQKKIISLFHYSLKPGKYLFLGSSEKIGGSPALFTVKSAKYKLYQRKETNRAEKPDVSENFLPDLTGLGSEKKTITISKEIEKKLMKELVEKNLLEHYQPTAILITRTGEILYIQGRTSSYLELGQGEINVNILRMARSGLRQKLRLALNKSVKQNKPVSCHGLKVRSNTRSIYLNLTVRKIIDKINYHAGNELFLVIFEEVKEPDSLEAGPENLSDAVSKYANKRIRDLKLELKTSNEELQVTLEETETTNEELKSINEEMQSMNEELQASNSELEVSREELQDGYQKLNKVNKQLEAKLTDLNKLNNDMNNLLSATGMGTIFVDTEMKIRRFTPGATRLINLIEADIGRPLGHIVSKIKLYDRLEEDIKKVLDTLQPEEMEVQNKEDFWFLLRMQTYRSAENIIEGVLVTFTDITTLKKMEADIMETESLRRLAVVVRDSNDAIIMYNLDGLILAWNPCAAKLYGWSESEALKMNIKELIPPNNHGDYLSSDPELCGTGPLESHTRHRMCRDGKIIRVSVTATALLDDAGKTYAISTTERLIKK